MKEILSLPIVRKIKEVYSYEDRNVIVYVGCFIIIAPDPKAGLKNMYSVIMIDYQTGEGKVIGRELPLKQARSIAKNYFGVDGKFYIKYIDGKKRYY